MSLLQRMAISPTAAPLPAYQEPSADSWAGDLEETSAVSAETTEVSADDSPFFPPTPQAVEQTGISDGSLEDLILKTLYSGGEIIGRELAAALGLKFSLIEPRVEFLKNQRHIQVKGSLGFGSVSAVFGLSEAGRIRVRECL